MDYRSNGWGLLLVYSLASLALFMCSLWLGWAVGPLQGKVTTWLPWLFKANRALAICQGF